MNSDKVINLKAVRLITLSAMKYIYIGEAEQMALLHINNPVLFSIYLSHVHISYILLTGKTFMSKRN